MYRLKSSLPLILASGSPRRQEMLKQMGIGFEVHPAEVDETLRPDEDAIEAAKRLALLKASCVAHKFPKQAVLAADTLVAYDKTVLGKPNDKSHAFDMLKGLSGREHLVVTGFCLIKEKKQTIGKATTEVKFRNLSDREIKAYVNSLEPMDKAGAYAVQGLGAALVEEVKGSYTNVVGLPLAAILALLLKLDLIEPCG